MSKILKKIPVMAMVLAAGVLSVSLTTYAYFSYNVRAEIETIQTAGYAIKVTPVQEPAVAVMSMEEKTSIAFDDLGITDTEEKEVSFKLTASGSTTAGGYCRIVVGDMVYYTNPIAVDESYIVTIKGNKNTVVNFEACWGILDMEEASEVTIIGENVSVTEPSVSPSVEPSATPSTVPSPTPSVAPSAEPSSTPSAAPSEAPSAEPSSTPSPTPSAAPSEAPSAEPSPTPSEAPGEAPSTEPSPTPSAAPSEAPSTEPSATPSTAPSENL